MTPKPIRALIIAESANPELTSGGLIGWLHSEALMEKHDAHMITELRNRDALLAAGLSEDRFTAIDSRLAQGMAWRAAKLLRRGGEYNWSIYTAMATLAYPIFERKIWKLFGDRLKAGEFDVVHRVNPVTPVAPSPLAKRCAKLGVPFVLGPINGGVPWPEGFDDLRERDRDWLNRFRSAHKLMPGYRSTREHADAIVVASRITKEQLDESYYDKCIYSPENSVDASRFALRDDVPKGENGKTRICFVGRLVALKGVDMLLDACEPLLEAGKVEIDIIGDGPEAGRLKSWVEGKGFEDSVHFPGWIAHGELHSRLKQSPIFAFPSVREFGGGAVLEAMAMGITPVVLNYGGPGDLVPEGVGIAIELGSRAEVVERLRDALAGLVDDPKRCRELGENARKFITEHLTWKAKAEQMGEIYRWVMGEREERPDWGTPFPYKEA